MKISVQCPIGINFGTGMNGIEPDIGNNQLLSSVIREGGEMRTGRVSGAVCKS